MSNITVENAVVFVTGANRGIGLALAERFEEAGYRVIGTARKPSTATELKATGARVEQLDVTDSASVSALAERLDGVAIDVVINNAGIIGHNAESFADLQVDKLATVLDVNSLGPLRVTQALLPNLEKGKGKTVANISSVMGSIESNWGCCIGYRASKSALNMMNSTLALEFAERGYTFVVLHPGYVKTDMNAGQGNITTLQSSTGLFKVISGLSTADNGRYYDFRGEPLPW